MNPFEPSRLHAVIAMVALSALTFAAPIGAAPLDDEDESSLPASLRSGYVDPIIGPANNTAYARGALGLIRQGYGKSSLFAAWRVMQLPAGALKNESHERKGDWVRGPDKPDEEDAIETWLKVRREVVQQAPTVKPDYYRSKVVRSPGFPDFTESTGQCGPDAFRFAATTLRSIRTDEALTDGDRKNWVAGQDAVFARCSWVPGSSPMPAMPALLGGRAPARMKSLNAYQRAAALFYGDQFAEARQAFDAIVAVPGDPMRPHAALGALRSVLRDGVLDAAWDKAFEDVWVRRGLRGDAYAAAIAEPAARRRARTEATLAEINRRFTAIKSDASLSAVQNEVAYTVRRALIQLLPAVPLDRAMKAMSVPTDNPYATGAVDLFRDVYPILFGARPAGESGTALRAHAWFDFVVTVQGCDATIATDPAVCGVEHAHALARWSQTKHNAWLVAVLMTAMKPTAADLPAAEAALAVPADRPEWASLQFYAAHVLAAQNRHADARRALDTLIASKLVHKRDLPLVVAARQAL